MLRVGLFITCLSDAFYPEVGISVVRVLRRLGVEVGFPEGQACCGQPAFNSGYWDETRQAARQMIRAFKGYDAIVAPSGSCVSMVRHNYPKLFSEDAEWKEVAEELARKCYEFSEFIVKRLGPVDLDFRLEGTATYHQSCHMSRMLNVVDPPLVLLSQVKGLKMKELPYHQDCCGFGGAFSVKMPEISQAMADEKIEHIQSTDVDYLIGSDMGCLMHMVGRMHRKGKPLESLHVAQVLDRGLSHELATH